MVEEKKDKKTSEKLEKFRKKQLLTLKKALNQGRLETAKEILDIKPSISIGNETQKKPRHTLRKEEENEA